ncbi:hypothetical protein IFM89_004870 [Coptis chinensis]|uniref:Cyclin-like domain-containing protein n=1 Tax=Coptis chinensis TaxID=261450 RepID=A0A835M700_9MAGN|nr:hypothetical protein IFM89_004870 [Coptis chinensis]
MAPQNKQQQQSSSKHRLYLLDALYCEEERLEEGEESECENSNVTNETTNPTTFLLEQDLFWEDEEVVSLFSKEKEPHLLINTSNFDIDSSLVLARKEAVEWMLKVDTHYGFSALTAVLAVNYLDRFMSSLHFQKDKPWMTQLAAVACLSVAAKVEETQVPLLLDLQVEETKYVFEAKTIQRMELLVLSTLHWRMNQVTPLSFLDHKIRRLGLKNNLHWEFMKRCERVCLNASFFDSRTSWMSAVLLSWTLLQEISRRTRIEFFSIFFSKVSVQEERESGELRMPSSSFNVVRVDVITSPR